MLNLLIRIGMAIFGMAMLIEVLVPPVSEPSRIDRHELVTRRDTSHAGNRTDTAYRQHFFGSRIGSCDVGATAYDGTADGDNATVRYSRIFKTCTAIDKAGVNVYRDQGWRWLYLVAGVVSLLTAFGAFSSFEFEGRQVY
jgi:hypothetical protein